MGTVLWLMAIAVFFGGVNDLLQGNDIRNLRERVRELEKKNGE